MASEMEERVAKAICKAEGFDPDSLISTMHADPTKCREFYSWEDYTGQARAAIEAMRAPTGRMCVAGFYSIQEEIGETELHPDHVCEAWETMIAAALTPSPTEDRKGA